MSTVEEPAKVEEAKEKSEDLIGEEGPAIELKENLPDIVQVNTGEENEDVNNFLFISYFFLSHTYIIFLFGENLIPFKLRW